MSDCDGVLHERAVEGIRLFNEGRYFEAHEELEAAWKEERGKIRELYQGILEAGVTYLHIQRGNYAGARKVYKRSMRWLKDWPEICCGVDVGQLRTDLGLAVAAAEDLGEARITSFDLALLKPVKMSEGGRKKREESRPYVCDRCGSEMYESNCKIICPNCGNRFDCSDLNIYFD
jgi:predicted metal-dependent hydrolase